MKKLMFLVIVLLVAVLMTLTRPNKAEHKEAMMKAVKELVDEEAENKGFKDNGLTRFGKNVVNKAIELALGSKLKLDDYYLFNTTHVRMDGKDKLLSVGMFGHVFTFDKKMLREALEEGDDSPTDEEKAAAKAEKKRLKAELKEQKRKERAERKEQKRKEREAKREQKRKEREAKKTESEE